MSKKCLKFETKPASSSRKSKTFGMTVIELMLVLSIVGILTSIAVTVYASYRDKQNDTEAVATLNELYAQATQALAEWGIDETGTPNNGIQPGCVGAPCNIAVNSYSCQPSSNRQFGTTNIKLPSGVHHWRYQLCFGYVDKDNKVEGFHITAHQKTGDDKIRAIIYGTGIESPVIEKDISTKHINSLVPAGATIDTLGGVAWKASFL